MPHRTDVKCPGFQRDGKNHRCVGDGTKQFQALRCRACFIQHVTKTIVKPAVALAEDQAKRRTANELGELRRKYDEALKLVARQERDLRDLGALGDSVDTFTIKPKLGSKTAEAIPVLVASDWHTEETVTAAQTSGLNEFNATICRERVTRFFRIGLRLIKLLEQDVTIPTVVLPLLGDFITGHLHEEAAETNGLLPIHAVIAAQNLIASGLQFILDESKYDLVVPCKVGNHSRTTKKVRFGTENGHSLEYLMYVHLASHFRNEPRVKFQINEGYHHYLDVFDMTVRFHHGHAINYQGGIGGIFIPAFKAISQWDKGRPADLDVFGHFHQTKDGGKFLSNGSLIGYNSYALSIKADYEPPRQTLFLIDKKRGRTCTWPVML